MRFLILVFAFTYSIFASANKPCGQVIQTTGRVDILKAQNNTDLERYAKAIKAPYELLCTDVIVTQSGSRAKIKFANGIITLGPNTRIAINKVVRNTNNPSILNLTYGKIRTFFDSEEAQKQKEAQFKVKTSTAVIGVRGTDFYVKFDPNKDITKQATLKGQVEVEQVGTKQKVVVNSGQQVDVAEIKSTQVSDKIQEDLKNEAKIEGAQVEAVDVTPKLEVKPIEKELVVDIRQTSALVKTEEPFTSPEAVKVLGEPEKWVPPVDEIPGDLKEIENIF